jgi:hypothetical protein
LDDIKGIALDHFSRTISSDFFTVSCMRFTESPFAHTSRIAISRLIGCPHHPAEALASVIMAANKKADVILFIIFSLNSTRDRET